MKGPPLGPGGEDITWPNQIAPRGPRASSTRNLKPQAFKPQQAWVVPIGRSMEICIPPGLAIQEMLR